MVKYHINAKGEPGACRAKKSCPLGGPAGHYDTPEEAREAYEVTQEALVKFRKEHKRTFEDIRTTPQVEDIRKAVRNVAVELSNTDKNFSWEKIMGSKRRTAKNIEEYYNQLKPFTNRDHIREKAAKYAEDNAYARAYEQDVAIDPAVEAHLESMWTDDDFRFGERQQKEELARLEKMKEDFEDGRILATKIIGTGYRNPKAVAKEYLDDCISETSRALETRGRSNPVNVSNAQFRVRKEAASRLNNS